MFAKCSEAQQLFNLEDYSVSQTTLEQVFLEFAKYQLAEDTKGKEKVDALKASHEVDMRGNTPTNDDSNFNNNNNGALGRRRSSGAGGAIPNEGSKHFIPMASLHSTGNSDAFAVDVAQAPYSSPRSRTSESGSGGSNRDYSRIRLTNL